MSRSTCSFFSVIVSVNPFKLTNFHGILTNIGLLPKRILVLFRSSFFSSCTALSSSCNGLSRFDQFCVPPILFRILKKLVFFSLSL